MVNVSAASSSETPIKIGIAVSLSGRYALLGQQVYAGVQCYADDVNATGGITVAPGTRPRPVVVHAYDDRSDIEHCGAAVRRLVEQDEVDLLMGPYGSGLTLAAARVAEDKNVVLWNHSGSADEIFTAGFTMLVGIISPASSYLRGVLDLIRSSDPGARRLVIVNAETGFARDVADGAEAWAKRTGFQVLARHRYPSGRKSFHSLVKSLLADPPDCLLGVGRVEDDLQLARDLCVDEFLFKAVALVVAGIDQFKVELGKQADGFLAPSQWEPGLDYAVDCGPSGEKFAAGYLARHEEPLDYPAAQGYVGGLIAQQCVEMARSLKPLALREAAAALRCTTFYGPFAIDAETGRQEAHSMLLTQWQNGRRKVVWPATVARTAFVYPKPVQ